MKFFSFLGATLAAVMVLALIVLGLAAVKYGLTYLLGVV